MTEFNYIGKKVKGDGYPTYECIYQCTFQNKTALWWKNLNNCSITIMEKEILEENFESHKQSQELRTWI